MKSKSIFILATILCWSGSLSAHYIWIETEGTGKIGRTETVKIYYGEFNEDQREVSGGRLEEVQGIECWAITPDGQRLELKVTKNDKFYQALFTPTMAGSYTIVARNQVRDVVDWSSYNIGVVRPLYYASKQIVVERKSKNVVSSSSHASEMMIVPYTNTNDGKSSFQLLFQNQPLKKVKVYVHAPNQSSKEYKTDENGRFDFSPLWKGMYVLECVYKEEKAGVFAGKNYEAIRHRSTFTQHRD